MQAAGDPLWRVVTDALTALSTVAVSFFAWVELRRQNDARAAATRVADARLSSHAYALRRILHTWYEDASLGVHSGRGAWKRLMKSGQPTATDREVAERWTATVKSTLAEVERRMLDLMTQAPEASASTRTEAHTAYVIFHEYLSEILLACEHHSKGAYKEMANVMVMVAVGLTELLQRMNRLLDPELKKLETDRIIDFKVSTEVARLRWEKWEPQGWSK
jgi:hypothetical protein